MTPQIIEPSYSLPGIDRRLLVRWTALAALATVIGALVALLLLRDERMALVLAVTPLGALAVRFPRHAFYVYAILYPLIANLRRDVSPIPLLRVNEFLIIVLFVAVVLHGLLHWPWRVSFSLTDLGLLFLLLTSTLIPFIVAQGRKFELTSDNINELVGPIKYYLIYRIARAVLHKREHVIRVLQLMLISSVIVSVIGVVQKPDLFNSRELINTYYLTDSEQAYQDSPWRDKDLYRVTSTTSSYNVLGGYLSITLIIAIFFAEYFKGIKPLLWMIPMIALNSLAFILTGNTAGIFGLLVALAIGTLCLRRIPRTLPPLIVGVVIAVIFFGTFVSLRLQSQFSTSGETGDTTLVGRSLVGRFALWRDEMLPALEGKYVFGVGPELPDEVWQSTEESQYLYLLFKGGLLYLGGYLFWTATVIIMCMRTWRSSDQLVKMLSLTGALITVALLYMGISNAYITYTSLMTSTWIVIAAVSCASQWARSEPADAQ